MTEPSYRIYASWPIKWLWQNRRPRWVDRRRAVAAQRKEGWAEAKILNMPSRPNARLIFEFNPPDRCKRDLHNMPATVKGLIDGIADAMGCDDEHFTCVWPETFGPVVKGGRVSVTISDGAGKP